MADRAIPIKVAADILGVETRAITTLMRTTDFCGEGEHGNLVSLKATLAAFRSIGLMLQCPCCELPAPKPAKEEPVT